MPRKKVSEMDDDQRKAVFANIGHVSNSKPSTYKPPKIHTQRKLVKKPHRVPLKKPTKHKVETKEGKITPQTKRGDALITNWNNRKIDSYAKKENKTRACYSSQDFEVLKPTPRQSGNPRILYTFVSKDREIDANVFWEPGTTTEMRGLVGDNDTIHIVYPLSKGEGQPPEPEVFLKSLVRRLKEKEVTKQNVNLSQKQRYEEDHKPIKDKIIIKPEHRKKAYYRGQKTGQVWTVHVPFKGGGFQNLTFDEKDDAEKYVEEIKSN